jgi:hypothetical protein
MDEIECVQCERYIKNITPEPIVMCGNCIKTHLTETFSQVICGEIKNKTYQVTDNHGRKVYVTLTAKL